jgi:L-fuculose-phosphate aldolase
VSDTLELLARQRGWSEEEARLRRSICEIGKLCYSRNYIVGADGNISARMSDGTILITPAGAMKGFLEPQQVARIHIACYEERPEIKAVVHAHPPHAVAMTIAGIDMQAPFIPEIVVTIGGIPTADFGTPGTPELAASIRNIVRCSDTLVMTHHGSVTLGTNLLDAYKKLDMVEHTARILYLAHSVGQAKPLSPEYVKKLLATREMLGLKGLNTLENNCAPRRPR